MLRSLNSIACCMWTVLTFAGGCCADQSLRPIRQSNPTISLFDSEEVRVDFGSVHKGCRKTQAVWLSNFSDTVVELARVEISCDCLQFKVDRPVAPGEQVQADICMDFGNEPNFTGSLSVIVKGWSNGNRLAFRCRVDVDVGDDAQDPQPRPQ